MRQKDGKYGKYRKLLCVIALFAAVALTGCGKDGSQAAGGKGVDGGLSRAEFIGMLGKSFGYETYISEEALFPDVSADNEYYDRIQAAAEWQILDGGKAFEPDKAATLAFVLESAVRAIGTDDIAASGAAIDANSLAQFYADNIAAIDLSNAEAPVDAAAAEQIIAYAKNYEKGLTLPQVTQMEMAEGVKTADKDIMLNADGRTGAMKEAGLYSVGDIVYIDATDTSLARAIKITEVRDTIFTFEEAAPEEVYSYLNIQGSFQGKVVEAISASDGAHVGLGQQIYDEMKLYNTAAEKQEGIFSLASNSAKVDKGSDHVTFTASFDVKQSTSHKGGTTVDAAANGKLVIGVKNIRADVKYEHGFLNPLKPEMIECKLYFDTEVSSEIHGSVSASIPLGVAEIQVWGPLNIKLKLTAHLGADGNISISYTTNNVLTAGWRKGAGLQKDYTSTPNVDFNADATLTAEATLLADLQVFSKSLLNAQITSGAVAAAKIEADPLSDMPVCVDVKLYVPLRWGVNQEPCLVTDINGSWKYSATIWDSASSPVQLHMHWEDWKRAAGDECTRGEAVEQELTTPEGEPLEEIDPFDFEPIEFDFIELSGYVMYLKEGGSMNIGFTSIPDGYTQESLKYEVLDPAVCSVANGTVQAKGAGSTIVKISTTDGMFAVSLAVTVNEDYAVEGFQNL